MKIEDILKTEECQHGGKIKEYAKSLRLPEEDILDFSANINPLKFPEGTREQYLHTFDILARYPDPRYKEFRKVAANFLKSANRRVKPHHIIPGNGSMEVLRMALQVLLSPGDIVVIPTPTFGEYERQSGLFGAKMRFVDSSKLFKLTRKDLADVKVVFLCNPNNPTGSLSKRMDIEELVSKCLESDTFVIVDEAFIELSRPGESVADLAISLDNLLILRSLTKCFSIPGLRLGYGVGNKELIKVLDKARLPWNLNTVASSLGTYLLQHGKGFLGESRRFIKRERKWLQSELKKLSFKVYPSSANFLLLDIRDSELSSTELVKRVSSHGILLRDASSFRGLDGRHVRLAIRTREENKQLVKALKNELVD